MDEYKIPLDIYNKMLEKVKKQPNRYKALDAVNYFFNKNVTYMKDSTFHKKPDYWQCRQETLKYGHGDCDDYAIAKYMTLLSAGVPQEDMYLAFVYSGLVPHLILVVKTQIKRWFGFGKEVTKYVVLDNNSLNLYCLDETLYEVVSEFRYAPLDTTSKLGKAFLKERDMGGELPDL